MHSDYNNLTQHRKKKMKNLWEGLTNQWKIVVVVVAVVIVIGVMQEIM